MEYKVNMKEGLAKLQLEEKKKNNKNMDWFCETYFFTLITFRLKSQKQNNKNIFKNSGISNGQAIWLSHGKGEW